MLHAYSSWFCCLVCSGTYLKRLLLTLRPCAITDSSSVKGLQDGIAILNPRKGSEVANAKGKISKRHKSIAIGLICPCADIPRFPLSTTASRSVSPRRVFKAVVTTSGYPEEFAHNRYWVFSPVTVNDGVLCLWPHFLSVDCRKSCSNFTSILMPLILILIFLQRLCRLPATKLRRTLGGLFCVAASADCEPDGLPPMPSSASISLWFFPDSNIFSMVGSRTCILVYLRLLIMNPP